MRVSNLMLTMALLLALTLAFSWMACGDDDDDDDSGSQPGDDDQVDDDDSADDDDDDDDTPPCEGLYHVIIDGQTEFGADQSHWTAKLTIYSSGTMTGVVEPDDETINPYGVSGFRYDPTTGYMKGSFPTPEFMAELCDQETVANYVDFTIESGDFTGVATFYCGVQEEENLFGTHDASGVVTCGDFTI